MATDAARADPQPGSWRSRVTAALAAGLTEAGALAALPPIEGTTGPLLPLAWPLTAGAAPSLIALSPTDIRCKAWREWPCATQSDGLPPPHALVTADPTSDGHLDAAWLSGSRIALLLGDDRQTDDGQTCSPAAALRRAGGDAAPRVRCLPRT